jgi:PAS domain S-box-containing protein
MPVERLIPPENDERPDLDLELAARVAGVWELWPESGRMRWTDGFAQLHGLELDADQTLDALELAVHPADRARFRAAVESAARTGEALRIEYRVGVGGEERWLEARAELVSEAGGPTLLAGVCADITEEQRAHAEELSHRTERLQSVTDALAPAATLAQVVNAIVREVLPALGAQAAAVYRMSEDGSTFELLESVGKSSEADFSAEAPGPAREALVSNSIMFVESPEDRASRWPTLSHALGLSGGAAFVWAPLEVDGTVTGVLSISFRRSRRFSAEDRAMIATIARQCAHALERARLYEAERKARGDALRMARRLRALQSIIDVAIAPSSLDELLGDLLARVREVLGTDTATILILDEERAELVTRASLGTAEAEHRLRVPLGAGFAGAIAAQRKESVVEDTSTIEIFSPLLRAKGVRSLAGMPLLAQDRIVGVLEVGTLERREFSQDDLVLLRLVASRAALAIEHTLLHERQRDIAETLQRSLLPERLPASPELALAARYVPGGAGMEVGGDWYDAISLPDGRLFIAVGDVVGRGIAAASAMGQLRNAVRAYALEGFGPAPVLGRLNQFAFELGRQDLFATVLVAVIDSSRREARLASAGHPPPLLVGPGSETTFVEEGRSLPLGAMQRAEFEEATIALPPGGTLVLYTDGLVERREETIDAGLTRLEAAAIEAPEELEQFIDHLIAASAVQEHGDDVAILAVRLLERRVDRLQLRYPARPSALASVRSALRDWLELAGASEEEVYEVTVACNEACTNSIEHPLRPPDAAFFEVEADCADGVVDLVVRDFGRWRDQAPPGDRGRGLKFIDALMESVDVRSSDEGTEVHMRRRLESLI